MGDSGEAFGVDMESSDNDLLEVELHGELDMAAATWVEDCLAAAAPHHRRLHIDLRKVTFIDSTGLRTLVALRDRAEVLGIELRLANPSDAVKRTLGAAGMTHLLHA
jgi:anti-sigma B factor antagonist